MGKFQVKALNPEAVQLENIFAVMSDESFGKDLSAKIVGGPNCRWCNRGPQTE